MVVDPSIEKDAETVRRDLMKGIEAREALDRIIETVHRLEREWDEAISIIDQWKSLNAQLIAEKRRGETARAMLREWLEFHSRRHESWELFEMGDRTRDVLNEALRISKGEDE